MWPGHHLNWIAITVVLLTERALEAFPVKITQRALGTLIGVIVAEALEASGVAAALPALVIAVLATGRPLLRANNYLAYTAVTTPLILLILETGRSPDTSLFVDRLAATLAGASARPRRQRSLPPRSQGRETVTGTVPPSTRVK